MERMCRGGNLPILVSTMVLPQEAPTRTITALILYIIKTIYMTMNKCSASDYGLDRHMGTMQKSHCINPFDL